MAGSETRVPAGAETVAAMGGIRWPDYYPPDCPPAQAIVADFAMFRLVSYAPPRSTDFLPVKIEQPHRSVSVDHCQTCGVSMYRDREDIERLRRRVPAFRNRKIARGMLDSSMGKVLHTPSKAEYGGSHYTWWLPADYEPCSHFYIVEEADV